MGNGISKLGSSLNDWRIRNQHLPWHRRYEFLLIFFIFLLLYMFLLLPPFGRPNSGLGWVTILLFYALAFFFSIIVIIDKEKPVLLKRICSLSIVVLFFWLFYTYSGTKWELIQKGSLISPS